MSSEAENSESESSWKRPKRMTMRIEGKSIESSRSVGDDRLYRGKPSRLLACDEVDEYLPNWESERFGISSRAERTSE